MALKMDREVDAVDLSFFLNEVASRGVVVSVSTAGSGVSMDNIKSLATVVGASSGAKPLGMLLNDFVSIDRTRQPLNWHKDQQGIGEKCTIMTKGWCVTDQVVGTPNAGDHAILVSSGSITNLAPGSSWNESSQPKVGRFRSKKDQDGFAKVYIDL